MNRKFFFSLVQGLKKAIELYVNNFQVFGDYEVVVRKIRDTIHCLPPHLKGYQAEVWNLIEHFNAFNINSIPRLPNDATDLLATSTSRLVPTKQSVPLNLFSGHQ